MANATVPSATIRPEEAAHFGALAEEWWDPKGSSAMLHKLNPPRLGFLRAAIDAHWGDDPRALKPLAGRRALDVGCGAGLLTEPLARLGAEVVGVDAAEENIAAARAHARGSGLLSPLPFSEREGLISYHSGELSNLGLDTFDLVTAMEVIEHVADKAGFVRQLAAHLAPGGLMVLSTPNRTPQSRLLLVGLAEAAGAIPKGTHRWEDFIAPGELRQLLSDAGLEMGRPRGIGFSPLRGLHLSDDLSLNYLVTARRS